MATKIQFYVLSLVTLIVFPIVGLALLYFIEGITPNEALELISFSKAINLIGVELGLFYGFIILIISESPIFEEVSKKQEKLLRGLNLNWFDVVFISLCAGIGEEILFRAAIQTWLGPWLTTFVFIAIHGYFSIKVWKKNYLGLSLFPFILLLAYGYEYFGLWFSIVAHASYDFVMFAGVLLSKEEVE